MPDIDFKNKTWILDGAFGTMLQKKGMPAGQKPEILNLTHPELIKSIHQEYAEAGSEIIYANTFGANRHKLADTSHDAREVIEAALKIAHEAADPFGALVTLDIGPIGELLEPMGSLSFEDAYDIFKEMIEAGKDNADLIVIETMTDLYEAKAALLAAKENANLPVFVTMSFEPDGRTFTGCTLESMVMTLEGLKADAIGLNCSAGPDQLAPLLKKLCSLSTLPVIAKPNAGLPDPISNEYHMDPDVFLNNLKVCFQNGVSIIGGCCGTTPEYIRKAAECFKNQKPVSVSVHPKSGICSPAMPVMMDEVRVIGERLNPTGKKRFQKALLEKDMDYLLSVALSQVEAGADILDVNVGYPGVDEEEMLPLAVKSLQAVIDIPLQLDSSNPKAIEKALRVYNGKASINSVSGKKQSQKDILPLAAKYGASVVGLTLDEEGIPQSAAKRVEIAKNILDAASSYGIGKEDVWIDCLCLTVSAQQEQAMETLKALDTIHSDLGLQTVLGVSNISFGLPNRPLIASTFLVQALQQGLTLPIINPNQKEMMDAISAFKVLAQQDKGSVRYIEKYSSAAMAAAPSLATHTLQECVIKGLKNDAARQAREELKQKEPLTLVKQDLIPALDLVGSQYEKGIMFLPQLLSAAQAAQSVFEVIRDYLADCGQKEIKKGKIVMATVKGDIHDIGKNIVKTVLENYGYEVIDLGKDVSPELVLETVIKENAPLVGLSALMTTTLPSMEETVRLLQTLEIPPRIMVGGAVVTKEYARKIQADFYCKDANDSVKAAREVFGS